MTQLKDCTHAKLIKAGIELFGNHGFDGVSVRQATNIVGVNVSAISYYFGSKVGYYAEVVKYLIETVIGQLGDVDIDKFSQLSLEEMQQELKSMIKKLNTICVSSDGLCLTNILLRESLSNNTGHVVASFSELIVFIHEHFEKFLSIYYKKLGAPDTDTNFVIIAMISILKNTSTRHQKPDPAIKYLNDSVVERLIEFVIYKRF